MKIITIVIILATLFLSGCALFHDNPNAPDINGPELIDSYVPRSATK